MHASVLRYLDQVARLGSIRRAAQVLNVASSAVNRQILKLEDEIGTALFERRRDGVRLTPAGERLLQHARQTLFEFQRTCSEMAALAGRIEGTVRIMSIRPLIDRFLAKTITEAAILYPQVDFEVKAFDPSTTGDNVDLSSYDLAIIFTEGRKLYHRVLTSITTEVGVIVPAGHPLAKLKRVEFTQCADYRLLTLDDLWIRRLMSHANFAAKGDSIKPRMIANSFPIILNAIRSGVGIGLFTPIGFLDEIEKGELRYIRLAEPDFHGTEISLIAPHDQALSSPAHMIADLLIERLQAMAKTISRWH